LITLVGENISSMKIIIVFTLSNYPINREIRSTQGTQKHNMETPKLEKKNHNLVA